MEIGQESSASTYVTQERRESCERKPRIDESDSWQIGQEKRVGPLSFERARGYRNNADVLVMATTAVRTTTATTMRAASPTTAVRAAAAAAAVASARAATATVATWCGIATARVAAAPAVGWCRGVGARRRVTTAAAIRRSGRISAIAAVGGTRGIATATIRRRRVGAVAARIAVRRS